ncbi:MAG: hypothetical protein ACXV8P_08095 [Methylobacter sp.]
MSEQLSHFATAVLSAALGYGTRVLLDKKSSNRKEDRETIDKIISLIENNEIDCFDYYCSIDDEKEVKKLASKITCSVSHVGRRLNHLRPLYNDCNISTYLIQYRRAITLNDFDSITRQLRKLDDPILIKISQCGRALIGHLEIIYKRKYR